MICLFLFVASALACPLLLGQWKNQHGSIATIKKSDSTGFFSGVYESAVGHASGAYALVGRHNQVCNGGAPTLSFSVDWDNGVVDAQSSTAWAGVFFNDTIFTTWLLAESVNSSADVWSATRIGTDIFSRQ